MIRGMEQDRQVQAVQRLFVAHTSLLKGFILGLLEKADLKQCLRLGAAMGASSVQAVGATTGVFNREQLQTFLAQSGERRV